MQKGGARTTYNGITCFTVCALVFGCAISRDSGNANGCRISLLGGQLQHVGSSSRLATRTRLLGGATPVSFDFWNHGTESTQSNSSVAHRPTEDGHGSSSSQETAGYFGNDVSQSEVMQRACLWNHKAPVNDAMWESAVQNFGSISAGCCFLMEIDKGCVQPLVFDDSIFGECLGIIVQNKDGA